MWVISAIVLAIAALTWSAPKYDRTILSFLLVSVTYYCLGGTYYWGIVADGVFIDASWGRQTVIDTNTLVASATLLWAAGIWISARMSIVPQPRFVDDRGVAQPWPRELLVLLFTSLGAALYALKNSSFLGKEFTWDNVGAFFLIIWAYSDVLVPVIIFMIATRGYTKSVIALILFFVVYTVLGGFRYKLALLFLPILWDSLTSRMNIVFKIGITAAMGATVLALFAFMTLYRAKFGIPDLSVPLSDPGTQLLYGLFADANIVFGQTAIMVNYVHTGTLYPFDPILDTFKEWIPRALYPAKHTGTYVEGISFGLGSERGAYSGTAYSWLGEFMIMMGWWAMLIGPIIMVLIYNFLKGKLRKHCPTDRQYAMGLALVAATMGYYHFSRPYMPSISKGYAFMVLPYIYLCARDKARRRTASKARQPNAGALPAPEQS